MVYFENETPNHMKTYVEYGLFVYMFPWKNVYYNQQLKYIVS